MAKKIYAPVQLNPEWTFSRNQNAPDWMQAIPQNGTVFTMPENGIDLDTFGPGKLMDECVVYNEFESDTEDTMIIGIACDFWFEAWNNGELFYSTYKSGNRGNYDPLIHPFPIPVRKGKNLLAIKVRRGSASWQFGCAGTSNQPLVVELEFGPWLSNPDSGAMTVRFVTGENVAAGIMYRIKGTEAWNTCWHSRLGQIIPMALHEINLTELVPGKTYEYRIIMRNSVDPLKTVIDSHIYSFKVPDPEKKAVSFLYTADLQFKWEIQEAYLKTMFQAAGADTCDFFVLGGDFCQFEQIREELVEHTVQYMIDQGCSNKPFVFVRGNHELRGMQAARFPDWFGMKDGRTYGIFRYGTTAFLVLDCWEDKAQMSADYNALNLDDIFLDEEKRYIEEAMKQPEWTEAEHRVVLAHGTVYSNFDGCYWQPFKLQKMTDCFFEGKNPMYQLDLWMAGHSHCYVRSYPGSDLLASQQQPPSPFKTGETYTFPVLTVGGPGHRQLKASIFRVDIAPDRITAQAWDQDGICIDNVIFHQDGTIEELMPIEHFHCPKNPAPMATKW